MMHDLKWQPLAERRRDQRLTLFKKIVNGVIAIAADLHFNLRPSRNRNWKIIIQSKCNTYIFKSSFFPQTISDWNTLERSLYMSVLQITFELTGKMSNILEHMCTFECFRYIFHEIEHRIARVSADG